MTVRKIRGTLYVDFRFGHADGVVERVRKLSPVQSRAGAQEYERQLRARMILPTAKKEVPTFKEFAQEFMRTYAATNNKPSEQESKRCILEHHLLPALGHQRLDQITARDVEALKAKMLTKGATRRRGGTGSSRKRINNVLACLGKILRYAHEIEILDAVPKLKLLKLPLQEFDFLTSDEYARLMAVVEHARQAMFLVAGDAGLRKGEIIALEWSDIDLVTEILTVRRSDWRGIVGTPKSGRDRKVPLTKRLAVALKAERHLRSARVFCHEDGRPLTPGALQGALRFACKRAGLRPIGWHVLRHTFCSHLAMQGASPKAVQELAGHSTLGMTLKYMHMTPTALREAIELLDRDHFGHLMGIAGGASR